MKNPYVSAKDFQLWYKSVSSLAPGHIDPVTRGRSILKSDKIATMGSCFAQHLSKRIAKSGFNYFIAEQSNASRTLDDPSKNNYGVFSARYGNIYTARQANQLFDRAFGQFQYSCENIWAQDGKFFDAFRPQIEVGGYETRERLLEDREHHMSCVRQIFEQTRWLIFTLGLTEAWVSEIDGAVLPVAPGVVAGSYDPNVHKFVNFTFDEVRNDLEQLVKKVCEANKSIEIILTVSPVPLIATYENRHVLESTTVSKAILRAAADEVERKFDRVTYFPSYEIITSSANSDRYFEDDFRQINDLGVNHVMRLFTRHFLTAPEKVETGAHHASPELILAYAKASGIVCDEEEIAKSIQLAGFST